jgi:ASCH domain
MKALTVRQPWASAIIWAGKTVENRSWTTSYRGRLYIHAGQRLEPVDVLPVGAPVPRGAIIGTVELTGCHRCDGSCSVWAEADLWHWVLADPVALAEPVPCRGALGLWTPPGRLDAPTRNN